MHLLRPRAGSGSLNAAAPARSRTLPPRWASPVPARRNGSTATAGTGNSVCWTVRPHRDASRPRLTRTSWPGSRHYAGPRSGRHPGSRSSSRPKGTHSAAAPSPGTCSPSALTGADSSTPAATRTGNRGKSTPAVPDTWSTSTSRRSAGSRTAAAGASTDAGALKPRPSSAARLRAHAAATSTFTPPSTDTADSPTPKRSPTSRPRPPSRSCTGPKPGSRPTASPASNASSRTTGRATAPARSPEPCSAHAISASRRYTPRHNGKVERYNRILAEEFLYARTWHSEAQRRDALDVWNIHYNYHRPHGAAGGRPPDQRLRAGVTNVLASYI